MKAVDLFCGAGGFSLGMARAGFDVVAAADNNPEAVRVYNDNLPPHAAIRDLSVQDATVEFVKAHEPTVLFGGPPCQDFSVAGKRVEGERADLTNAFVQTAIAAGVPYLLMENVAPAKWTSTYARARALLKDAGYSRWESIVNAAFCGVPQYRKRLFVMAWKPGADTGVPDLHMDHWVYSNQSRAPLTVKEYLGDEIEVEAYYYHQRFYKTQRAILSVDEPSFAVRGQNVSRVPPSYPGHPRDAADHKTVGPLPDEMLSRIQTFPEGWSWDSALTKTSRMQLIGNAVPPVLGAFMGLALRQAMEKR